MSDYYLLGVLNSSSCWAMLESLCSTLRGGWFELRYVYLSQLPIPNASPTDRNSIADLVQQCLDARGQGSEVAVWEAEIDERVARLYGLSGGGQDLAPASTETEAANGLLLP